MLRIEIAHVSARPHRDSLWKPGTKEMLREAVKS